MKRSEAVRKGLTAHDCGKVYTQPGDNKYHLATCPKLGANRTADHARRGRQEVLAVPGLPSSDSAADAAVLMERRDFLRAATLAPAVALTGRGAPADAAPAEPADRDRWLQHLARLSDPVLTNLAGGTLRAQMPIEQAAGADRKGVTHLEAFGRLMAGLAPWLELSRTRGAKARLQARYRERSRAMRSRWPSIPRHPTP